MVAYQKEEIEAKSIRIVIFRALQLGDMLCAVPAFRAIRRALPQAEITLLGLPWAKGFVERFNHYFDDFYAFPGFPGLPEQQPNVERFPDFLREIQQEQFDLAIQMHGSGKISNLLLTLFNARKNAGFYLPSHYSPDGRSFLAYPEHLSEVEKHLTLMDFLGIPLQGNYMEFPLYIEDKMEASVLKDEYGIEHYYICLHPGARDPKRRWPPERFSAVGDELAALGFQIILTGVQGEYDLCQTVAEKMEKPVINLAGKTSLGSLGALLSRASLLICNDTGVSHMAAALKVPSLILFSTSSPARWAPANRHIHQVIENSIEVSPEEVLSLAVTVLHKGLVYEG